MRPYVTLDDEVGPVAQVTVLINKQAPEEITAEFRHTFLKTLDPAERYDTAVKMLAAAYYQRAKEFSEQLTGLFGPSSSLADDMLEARHCKLGFEQFNQRYVLKCRIHALSEVDPAYQATYWHNRLFNADLPAGLRILGFTPLWSESLADPPVPTAAA